MSCRLLLPMCQSVTLFVKLINLASLCKNEWLFGVNTPGGPRNIVLDGGPDGGPDPHRDGEGSWEKFLPIVNPLHISKMAEANLEFGAHTHGRGP